jgi:hypothetical protein
MASSQLEKQIAAQREQIREVELKLATAMGAIDILRAKGAPNGFRVKGTYDPGTLYNHFDVVAWDGGSFVALKDGPARARATIGNSWRVSADAASAAGVGRRASVAPTHRFGAASASIRELYRLQLGCLTAA